MFYELMRRCGPFCFYAFDLLWLDGRDLRGLPLSERKALLRKLLPRKPRALVYVQHVTSGTDLFRVICERDMEGIVAKQAAASYTPDATTWVQNQEPALRRAAHLHPNPFDHFRLTAPLFPPGPSPVTLHRCLVEVLLL
jgi:hypothetical protein